MQAEKAAARGDGSPRTPLTERIPALTRSKCFLWPVFGRARKSLRGQVYKSCIQLTLTARPLQVNLYTTLPHFWPNRAKAVAKVYKTCIQLYPYSLSCKARPLQVYLYSSSCKGLPCIYRFCRKSSCIQLFYDFPQVWQVCPVYNFGPNLACHVYNCISV